MLYVLLLKFSLCSYWCFFKAYLWTSFLFHIFLYLEQSSSKIIPNYLSLISKVIVCMQNWKALSFLSLCAGEIAEGSDFSCDSGPFMSQLRVLDQMRQPEDELPALCTQSRLPISTLQLSASWLLGCVWGCRAKMDHSYFRNQKKSLLGCKLCNLELQRIDIVVMPKQDEMNSLTYWNWHEVAATSAVLRLRTLTSEP